MFPIPDVATFVSDMERGGCTTTLRGATYEAAFAASLMPHFLLPIEWEDDLMQGCAVPDWLVLGHAKVFLRVQSDCPEQEPTATMDLRNRIRLESAAAMALIDEGRPVEVDLERQHCDLDDIGRFADCQSLVEAHLVNRASSDSAHWTVRLRARELLA